MMLGRPGDLLAARYRLDRPIGSSGTVESGITEHWQGYDERLARSVTVRLSPAVDEAALAGSAQATLSTMARLNHPGVAAVYDVGVTEELGGGPVSYAVSEWTEGRTLGQIMAIGPQPWPRTSDWGRQIAGGLAALHSIGIVHGALGPNSVAIHDDRQVKILDAGLDQAATAGATQFGDTTQFGDVTSGGYAAAGEDALPLGAPDDVYALGMLLWEATVGAPPVFGMAGAGGADEPDRVPLLDTGAPPELAALLTEMLAADPAWRPTAAAAERRFGPFAVTERISDTLPGVAAAAAVAAPTQVIGQTGRAPQPAGPAAAATAAAEKRRRRGLLLGLGLLLAAIGVAVGLLVANLGPSNAATPTTSLSDTATSVPSTGAVTLPNGSISTTTQAVSSAPATSAAPSTAASSPSPSASPSASASSPTPSQTPSASASASSSASTGNGVGLPPASPSPPPKL
jgi:serine/threonine-protein kinase